MMIRTQHIGSFSFMVNICCQFKSTNYARLAISAIPMSFKFHTFFTILSNPFLFAWERADIFIVIASLEPFITYLTSSCVHESLWNFEI